MFTLGLRAAGAFAIGLGILPLVAGLASLWRAPGEVFRWELRVFRSVLLASIISFGAYTAVKGAWVSTTFATQTVERNLIYVAPLLMVGTALWVERRSLHPVAVGTASLFALYLVLTTPYEMDKRLDADAFGLAILQRLNRVQMFAFTPGAAKVLLVVILVASVAALLVTRYLRRASLVVVGLACAFVVVWNVLGELSAASASNAFSRSFLSNINGTPTWIDDETGGEATLYLGQQIQDPNSEQLLEFFNRSVKQVWSLDGTAPGPGPTLTPDLAKTDGTLTHDPGYRYVVAEQGIEMNGTVVKKHLHRAGGSYKPWFLYRLSGPLQLRAAVTGLYADGWSGPYDSAYTRYSTPGDRRGTVRVNVSWREWAGPNTAKVTVTMGTVAIGPDKQPAIGKALEVEHWTIHAHDEKTFVLPAPGPRFRVQVTVDPHFHPHDYDASNGDRRELGAVVKYTFSLPRTGT
jgi:hypothetical protein